MKRYGLRTEFTGTMNSPTQAEVVWKTSSELQVVLSDQFQSGTSGTSIETSIITSWGKVNREENVRAMWTACTQSKPKRNKMAKSCSFGCWKSSFEKPDFWTAKHRFCRLHVCVAKGQGNRGLVRCLGVALDKCSSKITHFSPSNLCE